LAARTSTAFGIQYAFVQFLHIPCSSTDLSIQPYSSDFSPLQESTACTDATNYATFQALFIDSFDSPGTFDMLSPPLVNTDLIAVSPDVSIIRAQSPSTQSTITSPPGDTDEIVCHVEFHNSFQFYHPNGNRSTKKTDSSMIEVSLHERFAKVMNLVRRLPSAERPKNALFTPFFTRKDDLYVCLLCPTKVAKSITNRTQIIQHITGRHGERRPFACPSWFVATLPPHF